MKVELENIKIEPTWKEALKEQFLSEQFLKIKQNFLQAKKNATIYPPNSLIFNAFNLTPFDQVKVVILGQDPYHGANQAMGLSFSVPNGVKVPPSLKNIYKEIYTDLGIVEPDSGDLTYWAKQGVLLLNATLSVEANRANSHKNIGWQHFTDGVINVINEKLNGVVFLLWGNSARAKRLLIDTKKHALFEAAHPSPLARGAFFGCKHFSKTNVALKHFGKSPIDWDLNNA